MEAEDCRFRSSDLRLRMCTAASTKAVTFGESAASITGIQKTRRLQHACCAQRGLRYRRVSAGRW